MKISKEDKIRSVMATAKGLRTQKTFASDCGLTPQYLSKLMTGDITPTDKTLKKIASHADNGVTLESLRKAFGISEDNDVRPGHKLSYTKAEDWGYVIGLAAALHHGENAEDIYEYLDVVTNEVRVLENGWHYEIDSEIVRPFRKDGIRMYVEADFTFRVPKEIVRVKTCLSWIWGEKKNLGLTISTDLETLNRIFPEAVDPSVFGSETGAPDMKGAYAERQALLPDADKPFIEKIKSWINEKPLSVPNVQRGYGFYLDGVSIDTMTKWCEANRRYWPDGLENPEEYDDTTSDEKASVPGLVARILRDKTGFPFLYVNPKTIEGKKLQEKPLIMVEAEECEADRSKYDRGTVLKACGCAAAELGIPFYGEVWYQWYQDLNPNPEYSTVFPDKKKLQEAKEDFADKAES